MEFGGKFSGSILPSLTVALNAIVMEGMSIEKALADAEKSAKAELRE